MADDGWTTLGELEEGAVFEAHPEDSAAPGILAVKSGYYYPDGTCQCVLLAGGEYGQISPALRVRRLDLPALLKELDELRTLTHDLFIDRDAAYGREVGRGEALATVEAEADRLLGLSKNATAGKHHRSLWHNQWEALVTVLSTLRALGPVRPLSPPERLAARRRALEDALRAVVSAWDDPGAPLSPQGAVDAARKLLEEISAGK